MRDDAPERGDAPVKVVGVAGKCCAGKDLVTAYFRDRGWHEINVDHVGHRALEAKVNEIRDAFGRTVVVSRESRNGEEPANGVVDRRALGALVFRSSRHMRRLEEIIHPWMVAEVTREVNEQRGGTPVVINAAILVPMGLHTLCDTVVLVQAPLVQRFLRGRRRDGMRMPLGRVVRRLWVQRRLDAQALASHADIITVENRGTPQALMGKLAAFPQLQ